MKSTLNKNTIFLGIAVIGVIAAGFLIFSGGEIGKVNFSGIFSQQNEAVAQKAVDYINNNELSQLPASLVEVTEESGLLKLKIKIGENEWDSYISKDGRFLFPQFIDMGLEDEKESEAVTEIQKTDNPLLEAYVVSLCPYGLQMQRAMAEAVKTLPELSQYVKVRYIGDIVNGEVTAMHGEKEAQENFRQICIREEQADKYWEYMSCYMKAGDATGCEALSGVDSGALNTCMSDSSRGLVYAQEDFDLNKQYGVTGSPTLMVGETTITGSDFGGRSAEAVKAIVCAAFNSAPDFCSTELETAQAAASFSETYAGSGSQGSAAECE